MAVLGLMAVTIVIGLTITAATINGLGFTSSSKASVQARAAAEAGVDSSLVGLSGSATCPSAFTSATTPKYTTAIAYLDASGAVVSCAVASQVRITSTGAAESPGVAGASSGDSSRIEAIYPYTPASTPGVVSSGAAIYLASGANFNNGGSIASSGIVPAIQVKTGNFDCDNNTGIIGSVVVVSGTMSLKKCEITGDAWASGKATLQTDGDVLGKLTAALPQPLSGSFTWSPSLPMPLVPEWTEFPYNRADWVTAAGAPFDEVVKTGGTCPLPTDNGSSPVIVNALGCTGGVVEAGNVILKNDLVVVAQKFTFNNSFEIKSSSAAAHRIWFVTPDLTPADNAATCGPSQGDFKIGNNLKIEAPISAMLYTPCGIDTGNGFVWTGQMYAGKITSWNNAIFGYVGVGLPGANLTAGTYTPGGSAGSAAVLGALTSHRDLAG